MKQKQNGSAHVILLGIAVVLISGALTYTLLNALGHKTNTESVTQQSKSVEPTKQLSNQTASPTVQPATAANQTYAEFSEWKVRFPTSTTYTLKRNSGTGNMAGYWISIDSLAQTCTTPDTPWLGFISQYTPSDLVENGPEAGKTYEQVFGKQGTTINGKLYVFKVMYQICTRNKSNPAVEEAAKRLEFEINLLQAY